LRNDFFHTKNVPLIKTLNKWKIFFIKDFKNLGANGLA